MRASIVGLFVAILLPVAAYSQDVAQLTVTGTGRAEAAPDMAVVSVGVEAAEPDAAAAMETVSQKVSALLRLIADAGIAASDVQTTGLSLYPNYVPQREPGTAPSIDGYTASNTVTLRVRSLDDLGGLLGDLVGSGANRLQGLSFDVADPAPLIAQARREAVADARDAAEVLAEAAGMSLGGIVSITDGAADTPSPPQMMRLESMDAAVPMAGGAIARTARVTVVWALGD